MSGDRRSTEGMERATVIEAQDAIAASFGEFEKTAWRLFAIARDLEAPEIDDDFAFEKPGPDHLRWFTTGACLSAYYELLDMLERLRTAATRTRLGRRLASTTLQPALAPRFELPTAQTFELAPKPMSSRPQRSTRSMVELSPSSTRIRRAAALPW